MKAYIAVSCSKREQLTDAMNAITAALLACNITPFIFVDEYHFGPLQEKEMMQQAMAAIDSCGFLIAETSHKAIGVGIEAGYAVAKNKPVIYIRSEDASHSTTLSGISSHAIIYKNAPDLEKQLAAAIAALFSNRSLN